MHQIIFATGNKSKLAQIRFVVGYLKLPIEIVGGKEIYGSKVAYEEIGDSVEDVSRNGALAVVRAIGLPVITEDTDFRVESLDGFPGIRAGEFLKNFGRAGLLKKLEGVENRKAVVSSSVAYATPAGECKVFLNRVAGRVTDVERFGVFPDWIAPTPDNPFGGGYNSMFIPDGWDKTLAEISPEEATPWSYRERNFVDVMEYVLATN